MRDSRTLPPAAASLTLPLVGCVLEENLGRVAVWFREGGPLSGEEVAAHYGEIALGAVRARGR
jgi:hypothetical protein